MIAEFGTDNTGPSVARFNGKVTVYAIDDGTHHGFLMPAGVAVSTALRMLAAVNDLGEGDRFSHDVEGVRFRVFSPPNGGPEGALTFTVQGAPFNLTLNATQIAEIAAAFTRASETIDGPIAKPLADR